MRDCGQSRLLPTGRGRTLLLRTNWDQLDASARALIEAHTGRVHTAHTAAAGKNSQIAVLLATDSGAVFVKGIRTDERQVVTQHREAAINPHVRAVSPRLLWHVEDAGWNLLGFEHLAGRHADYRPGSPDLGPVIDTMAKLATSTAPTSPHIKDATHRWRHHVPTPADLALLEGDTLLHTDWAPDNVIIDGARAHLIDWAWPTRGASFIDPACLVVRLIFAGHSPTAAESAVADLTAWQETDDRAPTVFAAALSHMWAEIAGADPDGWKQQMQAAAAAWAHHRG